MTEPPHRVTPALADPGIRALLVLIVVAVLGLVGVALAWRGVAAQLAAPLQLPFVASAAIGGLALTGAALALVGVQLARRDAASQRAEVDAMIRATATIAEAIRRRGVAREAPAPVLLGSTLHRPVCRIVTHRTDTLPLDSKAPRPERLRACRICKPDVG